MRPISEIHAFECSPCGIRIEVWTSARNKEVGATCLACGEPMRQRFTEFPKAQLAAGLSGKRLLSAREIIGWD